MGTMGRGDGDPVERIWGDRKMGHVWKVKLGNRRLDGGLERRAFGERIWVDQEREKWTEGDI